MPELSQEQPQNIAEKKLGPEQVADDVKNYINTFKITRDIVDYSDPENNKNFINHTRTLQQNINSLLPSYQNALSEHSLGLSEIELSLLDLNEFSSLSPEDQKRYDQLRKDISSSHFFSPSSHEDHYFYFKNHHYFDNSNQKEKNNLRILVENPKTELSQEELDSIYEYEKNSFKIHLSLEPKDRIPFLLELLDRHKDKYRKIQEIQSKKEVGEIPEDTPLRDLGVRLDSMNEFKLFESGYLPEHTPDFVFYVGGPIKEKQQRFVELTSDIAQIVTDMGLQTREQEFRYSLPFTSGDLRIPGLSLAQGNGNFKYYLEKQHPDLLEKYYDKDRNYAFRPDCMPDFENT